MADVKKINRCKYSHIHLNGEYHCVEAGWEDDKVVTTTEDKCEGCKRFKSRYIEYPITVNNIDVDPINYNDSWHAKVGDLVAVRPCEEECNGKTFLGFYLGDLPLQSTVHFNEKEGLLKVGTMTNPAMFVPELNKIIWGCGSWWSEIKSEDDLKQITDEDIENTWYVKLAKALENTETKED